MYAKLAMTALAAAFMATGTVGVMSLQASEPVKAQAAQSASANVTYIKKTDVNWPVRGLVTMEPCRHTVCHEA